MLGMVGPIDVNQKANETTGCYTDWVPLTLTFDLEFSMMWNSKEMSQLDAAMTGVPLALNFQGQIVSLEWEARLSWNEGDGSQ